MRTLDSHHHVWRRGAVGTEWLDAEGLEPIRRDFTDGDTRAVFDAHHVDGSVIVEACSTADETTGLLDIAESLSLERGVQHFVVGWVDLAGDVKAQVGAIGRHPAGARLVGVRHQIQGEPDAWFDTSAASAGMDAVLDSGLVFDLVVRADQLGRVTDLVRRHRGGTFVLDHLGKPPIAAGQAGAASWFADLERFAALPNVAAKLSGLVTEADWSSWTAEDIAPFVHHAVECFGPEGLFHGSDWPVCTLAADYGRVIDLHASLVDPQWHEAVFEHNARRTYGLDVM